MIAIININDTIFTLDGIRYFKNFAPIARGNKIALVCVYDSRLVLADWLDFSQYSVDGVPFANVALTVQALIPVVYARDIAAGGNLNLQQVTTNGASTDVQTTFSSGIRVPVIIGGTGVSEIAFDNEQITFTTGLAGQRQFATPDDETGVKTIATREWVTANAGSGAIVVSANQTAANDKLYHVLANATFTDPSPVAGKGYTVFVRNGTATIDGVAYTEGTKIIRVFHSGAWQTYAYLDETKIGTATQNALKELLITIELLELQSFLFFAPKNMKINSVQNIVGTPTIEIEVNGTPYTLGDTITQGSEILVLSNVESVINLVSNYE